VTGAGSPGRLRLELDRSDVAPADAVVAPASEDEVAAGVARVKAMAEREEAEVPFDQLAEYVRGKLGSVP